jgi:hypothetical protein
MQSNLLRNDRFARNKRFDSVLSGARKGHHPGGDVRGTDRNKAAKALRDRDVERTKPDAGVTDPTSSKSHVMLHSNPVGDFIASSERLLIHEANIGPERDPDRFSMRCSERPRAGPERHRPPARVQAVSTRMRFDTESKQHEQTNQAFVGL